MAATNVNDPAAAGGATTMRAWQYTKNQHGVEKSLNLNEAAARPRWPAAKNPGDHVLVKVHFASVNPVDYKLADGGLLARTMISLPATPGLDFSGVVAALPDGFNDGAEGKKGGRYEVGDRVAGHVGIQSFGSLAEYVVAPREALAHVPDSVALEHASGLATAGVTAFQSIVPYVTEGAGDRVFINGGSGGAGTYGIQIAKAVGCRVVASCSTANVELCRRLGADEVIDYKTTDVNARLREIAKDDKDKFKLVVDNVGGSPRDLHKASDDFLAPAGRYVQVGADLSLGGIRATVSRALLPGFLGGGHRKWEFLVEKDRQEDLARLAGWLADGSVETVVDELLDFADAPKAFAKLKTGRTKGKIVVRVPDQ